MSKRREVITTDKDTIKEDLYDGSLYPYPEEIDIDEIEVDVREDPFTVSELVRKFDRSNLITNPEFQRNLVWKPVQKSRFIESILLNIPLPALYLNQDKQGNYIVVDGLQRTTTLYDFLKNKYSLQHLRALPWLNNHYFSDLELKLQVRIEDRKIPCYIIKPTVSTRMIYDIFNRINTGGTQLNRQEVRNCIFIGNSTKLLSDLANEQIFKKAIDYGISPKRMKDREAILRYIAFNIFHYTSDYSGDMDAFLEKAMKSLNKMNDDKIISIRKDFLRVMKWTFNFFGKRNFRIPGDDWRGFINIAVLESVGYFFSKHNDQFLTANKAKIINNFAMLIFNPDYRDAVQFSTGDSRRVTRRFELAQNILGKV
jgi:uncharacterized protein with ParB-like and HNH nuclease domain